MNPQRWWSRRLWAGLGCTTILLTVVITVEPARLAAHTVLNGLRQNPIDVAASNASSESVMAPLSLSGLQPGTFTVTQVAPPTASAIEASELLPELPFDQITITVPRTFNPVGNVTWLSGGSWLVTVDFDLLQDFLNRVDLEAGIPALDYLNTRELSVTGPVVLTTTWASIDTENLPLVLMQFTAPHISGPQEVPLGLIARSLAGQLLPPIIAPQIDILQIALVRDILGLEPVDDDPEPQQITLPDGRSLVLWKAATSYAVLAGPVDADTLLISASLKPEV